MRSARCLLVILVLLLGSRVSLAQTSAWSDLTVDQTIPPGQTILLDSLDAQVRNLRVQGTLRISRAVVTSLRVGCNLIVEEGGRLDMGGPGDPVTVTHDLIFQLTQAQARAFVGGPSMVLSDCGLWVMGTWDLHGLPINRLWGKLAADIPVGGTTAIVAGDVSDWPIGTVILLTQTSDGYVWHQGAWRVAPIETERVTVTAVEGSTVTFTPPARFVHAGTGVVRGAVGILSQNLTIRTELEQAGNIAGDARTRLFAHTICMGTARCRLAYAAFRHMGHYGSVGRYPVHFHRQRAITRTAVIRGLTFDETGFRCTNVHESDGVLVEDTVCYASGGGTAHMPETDDPTQLADVGYVHNLVAHHAGKHFADRNNPAIAGERLRGASGFWLGTTEHELFAGNVSVGPAFDGQDATGFHWPEDVVSVAGTIPRTVWANEAHGLTQGWHAWQNRGERGHDLVAPVATGNLTGFLHGAYTFDLFTYGALFARNAVGYQRNSTFGLLQDSTVIGRGLTGIRALEPDKGIRFGKYAVGPHPWKGARYQRNAFSDLTPAQDGTRGTAIWRDAATSPTDCTVETETDWPVSQCSSSFPRLAGNTFGPDIAWYRFGWTDTLSRPFWPNTNSFWVDVDRGLVLLRKDQTTPQGQFPPQLVTVQSAYDSVSDALATPFASLPPSIRFTGLRDARDRPYPDYVLTLSDDPPPAVPTLTYALTDSQLILSAQVSPDTIEAEFCVTLSCVSDTQAPFEATFDLDALADALAPRRFEYAVVRAFDGQVINQGCAADRCYDGVRQRAYSTVLALTPEMRRGMTPPVPPDVGDLLKRIVALEAELQQRTIERDAALAHVAALEAELATTQAIVEAERQLRQEAERKLVAIQGILNQ